MLTGKVKWFDVTKGYGFIVPDDGGPDVFLHLTKVQDSKLPTLDTGIRLRYSLSVKNGKAFATDLSVIKDDSESSGRVENRPSPSEKSDFDEKFEREWGLRRS